jgi:hypothetical protein
MTSALTYSRPVHAFGLCTETCDHRQPDAAQVVLCRAWLRRWAYPRKSINTRHGSYGLKHDVEHSTCPPGTEHEHTCGRPWSEPYLYVTNGAFIKAALLEGYRAVPCSAGSPNAFFNMGFRAEPLPIVEVAA